MSPRPPPSAPWASLRRIVYLALVVATTLAALSLLEGSLQSGGLSPLEIVILVLYAVLTAWICASFWSAVAGFFLLLLRRDRFAINRTVRGDEPIDAAARTAILVPVYNEDPRRVFAGLRAMWRSLCDTGEDAVFDVFVLSDTRDPGVWVEEEAQWYRACLDLGASGRIFYRNRRENTARKSGNIADWIRGHGAAYRYMVVLDADSIMAGRTLARMVRLMEANPDTALVQAPPLPVNRETLFARILQFAASAYGPIFVAGASFWQMGQSNFWGHNAIIRVAPFARHCALPRLPGREPLGGEILSHDFVEAALLHRAGWKVWLAYDLDGSYEEIPTTLIDYAKRDRRWCQGNLQHSALVLARGLRPVSRLHLIMGIMSYLSSPLWFVFLLVTGFEGYVKSIEEPVYFLGDSFEPVWPISYAVELQTVLVVTLAILFLPKLLALMLLWSDGERRRGHGGVFRSLLSALVESVFSVLTAPVLMLFQTRFVWAILMNRSIGWPAQQRGERATPFIEALLAHGGQTLLGAAAGIAAFVYVPAFFWWFTPVLAGVLAAIPVSMLSSSVALGRRARAARILITSEETARPPVLALLDEALESAPPAAAGADTVVGIGDPFVHALHGALLSGEPASRRRRHYLEGLLYKLMEEGSQALSPPELRELLSHTESLDELHAIAWSRPRAS